MADATDETSGSASKHSRHLLPSDPHSSNALSAHLTGAIANYATAFAPTALHQPIMTSMPSTTDSLLDQLGLSELLGTDNTHSTLSNQPLDPNGWENGVSANSLPGTGTNFNGQDIPPYQDGTGPNSGDLQMVFPDSFISDLFGGTVGGAGDEISTGGGGELNTGVPMPPEYWGRDSLAQYVLLIRFLCC